MNANEIVKALRNKMVAGGAIGAFMLRCDAADLIESLQAQLAASRRRERAYETAIKRHYDDMTSQCFVCYSCVNHDARGHWDGKELYACSGCGSGKPKWQFDVDRFSQEVTK